MRRSIVLLLWGLTACRPASPPPVSGVSDAGIYYEASGRGDPVVFIHGFSLDRRSWDEQVRSLENEFRVVRYDVRGHGKSAEPVEEFSAHEDLRSVMDALDVERAALVGLSVGSQIAVDFALVYPARVTALVLAAPGVSGFRQTELPPWMSPIVDALRSGNIDSAVTLWAATPLMAIPQRPAADSLMRVMVRDNSDIWMASATLQVPLDPPALSRLADIRKPTLIIIGAEDLPAAHQVADTLVACVSGADKHTIPDAGHLVNLAAPNEFNVEMRDFLRQQHETAAVPASPCASS